MIPFSKLKLVFLQPGFLFCLKYLQGEKAKQLKMKCGNASGIFDAVEAIFELVGSGATEMKRHSDGPSRALAHSSVTGAELMENMQAGTKESAGKKPRKLTKEMILMQRQTEDELATQAALAGSFQDFHYDAAPTPSKKKPLRAKDDEAGGGAKRTSKKGLKHSSKQMSGDSTSTSSPPAYTPAPPPLIAALPPPPIQFGTLPPPPTNGSPPSNGYTALAGGPPPMPLAPPRPTHQPSFSHGESAYSTSSDDEE